MPGLTPPRDCGAPDKNAMYERITRALMTGDLAFDWWDGESDGICRQRLSKRDVAIAWTSYQDVIELILEPVRVQFLRTPSLGARLIKGERALSSVPVLAALIE